MPGAGRSVGLFDVDRSTERDAARDAARDPEAAARQRWRQLVGEVLPRAARDRPAWPVALDHCFARIVLDHVCGRPWREAVRAPAWKHLDAATLARAIAVAEAIVDGSLDLHALNASSLAMRGKTLRREARR